MYVAAQIAAAYSLHAGLKPADLENPNPASALQFLVNPSAQIQELQQALTALSGQTANSQVGLPCTHLLNLCDVGIVCYVWFFWLVIGLSMPDLQTSQSSCYPFLCVQLGVTTMTSYDLRVLNR